MKKFFSEEAMSRNTFKSKQIFCSLAASSILQDSEHGSFLTGCLMLINRPNLQILAAPSLHLNKVSIST